MSTASKHRPSPRAARFWARIGQWYGCGLLSEQFGAEPSPDWCQLIDSHDDQTVKLALVEIRKTFVRFPPKLPEADEIFARVGAPRVLPSRGPSIQERLAEFVVKHRTLTPAQLRGWSYVARHYDAKDIKGQVVKDHGVEIVGVEIPGDGDVPGFRVLVSEMDQARERWTR